MFRRNFTTVSLTVLILGTACSHTPASAPSAQADAAPGIEDASLNGTDAGLPGESTPDAAGADGMDQDIEAQETPDAASYTDAIGDTAMDAALDATATDAFAASDTWVDTTTSPDVDALPLPTADTATASCQDKRHKGDGKTSSDHCWDPPAHYCSGMEMAMVWFGCSPDAKACFAFDVGCHPCGWTPCPIVSKNAPPPKLPPGCPQYYVYPYVYPTVPPEVQPYLPTDKVFCWDGAPPEWKTSKFHAKDPGPPMP